MSRMFRLSAILLLTLLTAGCGETYKTEQFYAMGTFVSVTVPEKSQNAIIDSRNRINTLEALVKEETAKFNKNNSYTPVYDISELIKRGKIYETLTDGRFNIASATISRLYGFPDGNYSVPDEQTVEQALDNISRAQNIYIDLGAYAKGWIIDEAVQSIRDDGVKNAMVNAGGDLYAMGRRPDRKWRIAIQHPLNTRDHISVINLENMAVATSGDYERFFTAKDGRRIFHIFDATTGENPPFYHSVSVIAESAEEADGLATAFFLMNKKEVAVKCKKLKTPVLLYTVNDKIVKLCGWENFEKK